MGACTIIIKGRGTVYQGLIIKSVTATLPTAVTDNPLKLELTEDLDPAKIVQPYAVSISATCPRADLISQIDEDLNAMLLQYTIQTRGITGRDMMLISYSVEQNSERIDTVFLTMNFEKSVLSETGSAVSEQSQDDAPISNTTTLRAA